MTQVRHTTFQVEINSELLTVEHCNLWYSGKRNYFLNKKVKLINLIVRVDVLNHSNCLIDKCDGS